MRRTKLALLALAAVCALALGSEAFARGGSGGGGRGAGLRDGSCVTGQTGTTPGGQSMQGQRLRDGSGAAMGTTRQGAGQGTMRRLGPGDGTGNAVPPVDGTGSGSTTTQSE